MTRILTVVLLFVWVAPAAAQTRAEEAANILRNLKASSNMTVSTGWTNTHPVGLRRVVIIRQTAPAPKAPAPVRRRLDGTRLSNPPMVFGFTPHDWQWWYQWEVHREAR